MFPTRPHPDPAWGAAGQEAFTQRFPPQLLLFLAMFGASLYFMCYVKVGLDQELALPKVSGPWGHPWVPSLPCPRPPGTWGGSAAHNWWGGMEQGRGRSVGPLVTWSWEEKPRHGWKTQELSASPRPRERDDQAPEGLAMGAARDDCQGRLAEHLPSAGHATSSDLGSAAAHVTVPSSERQ